MLPSPPNRAEWEHRPFDSLYFRPSRYDPHGPSHVAAVVELRLGIWWAFVPDMMDQRVESREEGMALIEATLNLKGGY